MFLSFSILPSFAKTVTPVHSNQKANAYLGYLYQGQYTIYIYGDLQTGRVSSANIIVTATGQEIIVADIQNGGVSESGGVVRVNIKITTTDGTLIRVGGTLTK
ncbi:hypothetical protein [Pedobacter sp. NJ-S-72]